MSGTKRSGASQKLPGGLVALSSAAILTVYAAGYYRTRPAADRFVVEAARRNADLPAVTVTTPAPVSPVPPSQPIQPQSSEVGLQARHAAPRQPVAAAPEALPESEPVPTEPAPEAPAPAPEIAPVPVQPEPVAEAGVFRDGTYQGIGSCRHGDIEATVVVEGGRIASASISQCRTRYSCSWIAGLPPQVIGRQSAEVDYVSGATESTEAFSDAIKAALAKAK